jgi:hypothetical protein
VGYETSTHYFSCSGGPGAVSTNGAPGHVMTNLCFCIQWDMRLTYYVLVQWCIRATKCRYTIFHALVQWCIQGVKRRHTIHARVGQYGFHKRRQWTRYAEHVFLHPVGSACYVMHSGAFRAQNVNALFFMFGWARCGYKKRVLGHVMSNLCLCIRWDMRSHSTLWCVRSMKHQRTIFHARVGLVWIPQKACQEMLH